MNKIKKFTLALLCSFQLVLLHAGKDSEKLTSSDHKKAGIYKLVVAVPLSVLSYKIFQRSLRVLDWYQRVLAHGTGSASVTLKATGAACTGYCIGSGLIIKSFDLAKRGFEDIEKSKLILQEEMAKKN